MNKMYMGVKEKYLKHFFLKSYLNIWLSFSLL